MSVSPPSIALPDHIRAFLSEPRYCTLATVDPDGGPRQAAVWYLLEGEELVLNSKVGRRWPANLLRDPRVSVAVIDARDGYRWVGLDGIVTPVHDQATAQADIAAMARRYDGEAKAEEQIRRFRTMERISFRVRVHGIHDHLA